MPNPTRGRRTDPEVVEAIGELAVREGLKAPAIRLRLQGDERYVGRVPADDRTIRAVIARYRKQLAARPRALPPRWLLANASGGEAALVLPVMRAKAEHGASPILDTDQAAWIVKIRTAAPAIPPWDAFLLAQRYLRILRDSTPGATEGLDHYLALELWRDPRAWVRAYSEGDTDYLNLIAPGVREALAADPKAPADLRAAARQSIDKQKGKRS
jgi:hypothetical protein